MVLQLARSLLHLFIAKTRFVRPLLDIERSPQGKFLVSEYERASDRWLLYARRRTRDRDEFCRSIAIFFALW